MREKKKGGREKELRTEDIDVEEGDECVPYSSAPAKRINV